MPVLRFGASVRCRWSVFGARFWFLWSVFGPFLGLGFGAGGPFWGSNLVPVVRFEAPFWCR